MLLLAHWRGRKYRVLFALPCLAFGHLTHRTEKYTLRKRRRLKITTDTKIFTKETFKKI